MFDAQGDIFLAFIDLFIVIAAICVVILVVGAIYMRWQYGKGWFSNRDVYGNPTNPRRAVRLAMKRRVAECEAATRSRARRCGASAQCCCREAWRPSHQAKQGPL